MIGNRRGQLLIEIVAAIGVAVVALLAMSRISSRSVSVSGTAIRQTQASGLARSAIDVVKNIKEGLDYDDYFTEPVFQTGNYCFDGTNIVTATNDYCDIPNTEFEGRVVVVSNTIAAKVELTIRSQIRWVEGSIDKLVENEGKLILNP